MACGLPAAYANSSVQQSGVRELFHKNTHLIEKELNTSFPKIDFEFSSEVNDWYKFLLFEALTTLPEKHINNLENLSIKKLGVSRRGVLSFYMDVQSKSPRLKLKFNPVEFPLETNFECDTVIECMKITDAYMNREFVAVAIHEIGHTIDFGSSTMGDPESGVSSDFKNGPFLFYQNDPSVTSFYPICFKSAIMLSRKKCNKYDFVSTYAKTDVFEDFAETMTVYVLDGENFYNKALKNQQNNFPALIEKYNFFKDSIFSGQEFRFGESSRQNLFTTNDATLRIFPLPVFLYKY